MNNDILARLARACAHGTRQMQFVNELLAGEGYSRTEYHPWAHGGYFTKWGDADLQYSSWASLKKRLVLNGFMIKNSEMDRNGRRQVTLSFSV